MNEQERVLAEAHANLDRLARAIDDYAAALVASLDQRAEPVRARRVRHVTVTPVRDDIPMPVIDLARTS